MNVLLNGVGRVGKAILRLANDVNTFNVVAINELNTNIDNIAYSINYDSTYGRFEDKFMVDGNTIKNNKSSVKVLNHKSLFDIDFEDIDIIIDASGSKVDVNKLKSLDVKSIFLTHPNSDADINVILGVNEDKLSEQKVISTSSCNATALLPILKLIDDKYGIEYGNVTTIHPYLNHQKVLDGQCLGSGERSIECNYEFGRSATQNVIPSGTTTIEACSYIIPHLNKNIITSTSFRVPTAVVGAIEVTLTVKNNCKKDTLIQLFKDYEKNQKFEILLNNEEQLVSSDFQGQKFTTIVDNRFTEVTAQKAIKFVLWYDNEWGYSSKVVDIINNFLVK
jgi:glyceraldehyde 3-phosphate dehydrogenase